MIDETVREQARERRVVPYAGHASPQARYDLIVAGVGLTGLFAGALAAKRGARTLVVGHGLGGTHLGPGTIDVWGYTPDGAADSPALAAQRWAGPHHPLALAGRPALAAAVAEFQALCAAAGYPMPGGLERNHCLPTAAGASRPTCLAPESYLAGDLRQAGPLALAKLPAFRDFYPQYAAANLRAAGHSAHVVTLDLPHAPVRRDAFATDLARLFDDPAILAEIARLWRPRLQGVTRLGLPAILGYTRAHVAWQELSEALGLDLFEIPLLPPSVPGMRLFNILRSAIERAGGRVVVGPGLVGWVAPPGAQPRALGVMAETAGGPRWYAADAVILATGGFRHGGLNAPVLGQAEESMFNLPVITGEEWFAPVYWGAHPYARFGLAVNERMQPVDRHGAVIYPNLYAAGGVLAGADRNSEGSREGIDLATAWKAVASALELESP